MTGLFSSLTADSLRIFPCRGNHDAIHWFILPLSGVLPHACLQANVAFLALSSADRELTRLWEPAVDIPRVLHVARLFLMARGWTAVPLFGTGLSSGSMMLLHLAFSDVLPLRALAIFSL